MQLLSCRSLRRAVESTASMMPSGVHLYTRSAGSGSLGARRPLLASKHQS